MNNKTFNVNGIMLLFMATVISVVLFCILFSSITGGKNKEATVFGWHVNQEKINEDVRLLKTKLGVRVTTNTQNKLKSIVGSCEDFEPFYLDNGDVLTCIAKKDVEELKQARDDIQEALREMRSW